MKQQRSNIPQVQQLFIHPWKLKWYLFRKLPMGLLAGLRLDAISKEEATVSLPFCYLNKNPFRSIYFGSLSMGAELSSGILAMLAVSEAATPVSMLVQNMRAEFVKKATSRTQFHCRDGQIIRNTVMECIQTRDGKTIETLSVGTDTEGNVVARFWFTWTFKPKQ